MNNDNLNLITQNILPLQLKNSAIVDAMRSVARDLFIPYNCKNRAYENTALPIGNNQTISQPSLVAMMLDLLNLTKNDTVLEIGTGSGYQTALLSKLVRRVITIERIPALALKAQKTLHQLHITNTLHIIGDGSSGYELFSPYDKISVTASVARIPPKLISQLRDKGRIVLPVGPKHGIQQLIAGIKQNNALSTKTVETVRFVPLIPKK